ncbi:MAG: Flp pilus assembly complex ATPase component [Calditrichaeota bacterium]|nr:Flp pilus assembly complex ATPase component [Calditrichota bacterium]
MAFQEDQVFIQELIKKGLITKSQIIQSQNLLRTQLSREGITKTLLSHFKLDETKLAQSIAEIFNVPFMEQVNGLSRMEVDELQTVNIPADFRFIPVLVDINEITIAIKDPPYQKLVEFVKKATDKHIITLVLKNSDFEYLNDEKVAEKKSDKPLKIDFSKLDVEKQGLRWARSAEQTGSLPSAKNVLDRLLETARETNASDIHLEITSQNTLVVRFRLNGVLQRVVTLPQSYASSLPKVIKQIASIDNFEKNNIAEGIFSEPLSGNKIQCRVNIIPTATSEKITLRMVNDHLDIIRLERLGLSLHDLQRIRRLLSYHNTVILFSGPAGCGKTTTLYSVLNELNHFTKNITTIETPVEAHLEGVNQISVTTNSDLDFAKVMKALFHHDVDSLALGEVRSKQEAELLLEAGLSGMTAFATIQAADAIKTIYRLKNFGVEIEQFALALRGIVSQRFVRKVCPYCQAEYRPDAEILQNAGLKSLPEDFKFKRGLGCKNCLGTGYLGRIPVFEVLIFNETLSSLVFQNKPYRELFLAAKHEGFTTLRYDGLRKALAGITTLNEVLRVT